MSAPSFSSFPPSFTSFPDLDPGPSKRSSTPSEQPTDTKKREKKRIDQDDKDRKERKHKHNKHRGRTSPDRHTSRKHEVIAYAGFDDERAKAKEDSTLRAEKSYASSANKEQLPYYTDRKGDPLNLQYGGLHAGSVPRYHLVSGESVHRASEGI